MTAQAWATLCFAIGRVDEKAQKKLTAKRKSVGTCRKLEGIGQSHLQLGSPLSSHENFPTVPTQAHSRLFRVEPGPLEPPLCCRWALCTVRVQRNYMRSCVRSRPEVTCVASAIAPIGWCSAPRPQRSGQHFCFLWLNSFILCHLALHLKPGISKFG